MNKGQKQLQTKKKLHLTEIEHTSLANIFDKKKKQKNNTNISRRFPCGHPP